jgi:predicted nucleic acid-binding protein
MDIVIDTSAIISVIVGEPERERIIELTAGNILIGPGSIPWEIGNAFSAMFKQKRLTLTEAEKGLSIFKNIPIRYIDPNFVAVLKLSKQANIYAYDAYFLDCAIRYRAPLLTLDRKLMASAQILNVETLEV